MIAHFIFLVFRKLRRSHIQQMCALNSELMCVCYIKDEQKSLRPDVDVAIWPLTLIGMFVCVYVCVLDVPSMCQGEVFRRRIWSVYGLSSSSYFHSSLKICPKDFSFRHDTEYLN